MLLYAVLQVHLGSADAPQYMFAATLTLPFLGATLGLLRHNWSVLLPLSQIRPVMHMHILP